MTAPKGISQEEIEAAIATVKTEKPEVPQSDPDRADIGALSVTGLVRSIGALVKTVSNDQRIPIGTATNIVKVGLEYHLNSKALAQQEAQMGAMPFGARPVALPDADDTEDKE